MSLRALEMMTRLVNGPMNSLSGAASTSEIKHTLPCSLLQSDPRVFPPGRAMRAFDFSAAGTCRYLR